jgi:adenylosuccinate synthase
MGSGLGPTDIDYTLGITKAYTTRVGSGPFPTEDNSKDGILLGKKGHEFGTVTGRQRRCGWFDSVLVKQAVSLSSVKGIALTKLDVLDGFDKIKICTGYSLNGKAINYLPSAEKEQKLIKPMYEVIKGWKKSIVGVRNINDLPEEAKIYIKRIEELVNCPIILISTSPERTDTIHIKDPFNPN